MDALELRPSSGELGIAGDGSDAATQLRRAAKAAVELAPASPLDIQPLQSMRVVMGSTLVLTSSPEASPSASYGRSSAASAPCV